MTIPAQSKRALYAPFLKRTQCFVVLDVSFVSLYRLPRKKVCFGTAPNLVEFYPPTQRFSA